MSFLNRILFAVLIVIIGFWGFAGNVFGSEYPKPFKSKGPLGMGSDVYGYKDSLGNTVIKPKYDYAGEFEDGIAYVYIFNQEDQFNPRLSYSSEAWRVSCRGYIDVNGKLLAVDRTNNRASDSTFLKSLIPVKINDKWGYVQNGRFKIAPQFDDIWNKYSFLETNVEWNGISYHDLNEDLDHYNRRDFPWSEFKHFPKNSAPIDWEYDYSVDYPFQKYAFEFVNKNGYWGVIDSLGYFILPANIKEFQKIAAFGAKDDYYIMTTADNDTTPSMKAIAMLSQGTIKYITSMADSIILDESWNRAYVFMGIPAKWGIIDEYGHFIQDPRFDEIKIEKEDIGGIVDEYVHPRRDQRFLADIICLREGNKWGVSLPYACNYFLDTTYDKIVAFSINRIWAENDNRWGVYSIDSTCEWDTIAEFTYESADNSPHYEGAVIKNDGKYGLAYFDKEGKPIILDPSYDSIYIDDFGWAFLKSGPTVGFVNLTSYKSQNGVLVNPQYNEALGLSYELLKFRDNAKWGAFSATTGLLKPQYDDVAECGIDSMFCVRNESKWGCVYYDGDQRIAYLYDNPFYFDRSIGYKETSYVAYDIINDWGTIVNTVCDTGMAKDIIDTHNKWDSTNKYHVKKIGVTNYPDIPLAYIIQNGKKGIIDISGKVILMPSLDITTTAEKVNLTKNTANISEHGIEGIIGALPRGKGASDDLKYRWVSEQGWKRNHLRFLRLKNWMATISGEAYLDPNGNWKPDRIITTTIRFKGFYFGVGLPFSKAMFLKANNDRYTSDGKIVRNIKAENLIEFVIGSSLSIYGAIFDRKYAPGNRTGFNPCFIFHYIRTSFTSDLYSKDGNELLQAGKRFSDSGWGFGIQIEYWHPWVRTGRDLFVAAGGSLDMYKEGFPHSFKPIWIQAGMTIF